MYSTQEPLWVNLCCMGICIVSECVFDVTCICVNVLQVCVSVHAKQEQSKRGRGEVCLSVCERAVLYVNIVYMQKYQ